VISMNSETKQEGSNSELDSLEPRAKGDGFGFKRWLEGRFEVSRRGSSIGREIVAGVTTFTTMSYVLVVHPKVLAAAGMDATQLITVTALAAAIFSVLMGLWTNYPIALAPGMGVNAFFAYQVCLGQGIPWPSALGLVFYSGLFFFLLSISGIRRKIIESFPPSLKGALTGGIGLFIAFIGLKAGGLIVANPKTFVTLGDFTSPTTLLTFFGIALAVILLLWRVRGALIISILVLTFAGLFLPASTQGPITTLPTAILAWPSPIDKLLFKLDFSYFWLHPAQSIPIVFSLLFADLFGSMAALLAIGRRARLLDANGNLPRIREAFGADAAAAAGGALLGTSTTIQYIESAAGVEEGGRTGLVSIVVAMCFLLALFLNPIIRIVPLVATAPALVIVGVFMLEGIADLDLNDLRVSAPAAVTILLMLLGSVADGLVLGFILQVLVNVVTGKAKTVSALSYILAGVLLLHYLFKWGR
jgi:adenine/guanine/hypoxanthine permease